MDHEQDLKKVAKAGIKPPPAGTPRQRRRGAEKLDKKTLEQRIEDLEKRFDILEKILEAYRK